MLFPLTGADVNTADEDGDTPLHFALMLKKKTAEASSFGKVSLTLFRRTDRQTYILLK